MKFRSSLFKGLRFPKAEPWSPSADGEIPQSRRSARGKPLRKQSGGLFLGEG